MKVLVTGTTGNIGRQIVAELVRRASHRKTGPQLCRMGLRTRRCVPFLNSGSDTRGGKDDGQPNTHRRQA